VDEQPRAKHPRVEWLKTNAGSETENEGGAEQKVQETSRVSSQVLGSPCGLNDDSGIESMDTQSDKGEASSESPNRRDDHLPQLKNETPAIDVKPVVEKTPKDDDQGGPGGFDGDIKSAARFASASSTIQTNAVSKVIPNSQAIQKLSSETLLGLAVGSQLNLPAGTKMVPVRVVPLTKSSGEATYLELNAESSQFLKSSPNQVAIMTSPVKFLVSKVGTTSPGRPVAPSDLFVAVSPKEKEVPSTKPETPVKAPKNAVSLLKSPSTPKPPVNGSDAMPKENCSENGEINRIPVSIDHNYVLSKSEVEKGKPLEQLTIEIPSGQGNQEEDKRMTTRSSTRSASRLNSPQSREEACTPSPCSTSSSKSSTTKNFPHLTRAKRVSRGRNTSGDSNASLNSTSSLDDNKKAGKRQWSPSGDDHRSSPVTVPESSRPGKRRCSENATELIKACMGVDEHPGVKKPCLPVGPDEKKPKEDENLRKVAARKAKGAWQSSCEPLQNSTFLASI
jgi:hypothetical protein